MTFEVAIFDLGGVVVEVNSDRLVLQISQLCGMSFEEARNIVYHDELLLPFELGRITPQTYYEGLKKKLKLSWTYEQFVRAWNGIFVEKKDVTEILKQLRTRYKLVALSNTNVLHLTYIQQTFPSLQFHDWIASSDVGMRKPEREFYQFALNRAGTRAEKTIYVDDRPEMVEAAKQLGVKAIRFENSKFLQEELQRLGVNV